MDMSFVLQVFSVCYVVDNVGGFMVQLIDIFKEIDEWVVWLKLQFMFFEIDEFMDEQKDYLVLWDYG